MSIPNDIDLNDLTVEQLDAALDGATIERVPEPAPQPDAPPEPAQEPAPEAAAEAEEAPEEPAEEGGETVPEPDFRGENAKLREMLEQAQARLAQQERVNGRLAGENGFLKQRLGKPGVPASAPEPPGVGDFDASDPDDRGEFDDVFENIELRNKLEEYQRKERIDAADRAVVAEATRLRETGAFDGLTAADIAPALERNREAFRRAMDDDDFDVEDRVALLRSVTLKIAQEARQSALQRELAMVQTRARAQQMQKQGMKVKAAISGTGAAPPSRPRARSWEDMSIDELEREIQRQIAD